MTTQQLEVAVARPLMPEQLAELGRCATSFREFLKHWHFVNRETGEVRSFGPCWCAQRHAWALWPGQSEFAGLADSERQIIELKAGKQGITEIECAFDGWVARFGHRNALVNLFSMDGEASKDLMRYVKFGLLHLPEWMQLPLADDREELETFALRLGVERDRLVDSEAGARNTISLRLVGGVDDVRTVRSYAAGPDVSIDKSATHSHVDELARMRFPESTWTAIRSTIPDSGSVHVISRGKGAVNYMGVLFQDAMTARSEGRAAVIAGGLEPHFISWRGRPDRDDAWYEAQRTQYGPTALKQWAPNNWREALAGGETLRFRFDEDVHVIEPFPIPEEWLRWTGTDYGFSALRVSPWYTGFLAESPNGTVYLYDEVFGSEVAAPEQARRIKHRQGTQKIEAHACGPDFFQSKQSRGGGVYQVADDYREQGVDVVAVSNDRVQGWAIFDKLLGYTRAGDVVVEQPKFFVFRSCREFLRTFPAMLSDPHKPDDCETDGEDDPPDAVRYGLMWRQSAKYQGGGVDMTKVGAPVQRGAGVRL